MERMWNWKKEDLDARRQRVYGERVPACIFVHPVSNSPAYDDAEGVYVGKEAITRFYGVTPTIRVGPNDHFSVLQFTEGTNVVVLYLLETIDELIAKMRGCAVLGELKEEKEVTP